MATVLFLFICLTTGSAMKPMAKRHEMARSVDANGNNDIVPNVASFTEGELSDERKMLLKRVAEIDADLAQTDALVASEAHADDGGGTLLDGYGDSGLADESGDSRQQVPDTDPAACGSGVATIPFSGSYGRTWHECPDGYVRQGQQGSHISQCCVACGSPHSWSRMHSAADQNRFCPSHLYTHTEPYRDGCCGGPPRCHPTCGHGDVCRVSAKDGVGTCLACETKIWDDWAENWRMVTFAGSNACRAGYGKTLDDQREATSGCCRACPSNCNECTFQRTQAGWSASCTRCVTGILGHWVLGDQGDCVRQGQVRSGSPTPPPIVPTQPTTAALPTAPGCWALFPSGCPNQAGWAANKDFSQWQGDNFDGAGSSAARCAQRDGEYESWCGVSDVRVHYVSQATTPSPPPHAPDVQSGLPSSPGCYYKQPTAGNGKCGGPYLLWTPDEYGRTLQESSWASQAACVARKQNHDEYCGTATTWAFVE